MKRPPVILFAGRSRIAIPYAIYLSAILVMAAACLAAVFNSALPRLLGTGPIWPIPVVLQTIANVLAFFMALAVMIASMMILLGKWEALLTARRLGDFERLISLPELLSSQFTIAPNLDEVDRSMITKALQELAAHGGTKSIFAPATAGDIEDSSVDRLFVMTTQSASHFRRMVRGLKCDDVSRIPVRYARQIAKKGQFGNGSMWLLTWD